MAVSLATWHEIDIVSPADTTKYLGYKVGTGELTNKNWAQRIRKIQRRLLTAIKVATSVKNRVLILNSIVLPSLLFTAIAFDLPRWAEVELSNLYKQFLWAHATSNERCRHKVNPGILVTPKKAGGVGLVPITVAIKTQRLKHAVVWLTQ
uniref:Reverse transcriptase n=1 Tax=Peronospora matthiolae TaxID=2874970 RepID=A0AAV1V4U5_9STRA